MRGRLGVRARRGVRPWRVGWVSVKVKVLCRRRRRWVRVRRRRGFELMSDDAEREG